MTHTTRYLAITPFAILLVAAQSTAQLATGQYRATFTTSVPRQLAGRVTYTRCGSLLHIWLADTLSPGLSMEFGTTVATLRPGRFRAEPIPLLNPAPRRRPLGTGGYFRVYLPPDTLLFADSGALHFTDVEFRQIVGEVRVAISEAWNGRPQVAASLAGSFRAVRDSIRERIVYRGARCDHPGAEWPRVNGNE